MRFWWVSIIDASIFYSFAACHVFFSVQSATQRLPGHGDRRTHFGRCSNFFKVLVLWCRLRRILAFAEYLKKAQSQHKDAELGPLMVDG